MTRLFPNQIVKGINADRMSGTAPAFAKAMAVLPITIESSSSQLTATYTGFTKLTSEPFVRNGRSLSSNNMHPTLLFVRNNLWNADLTYKTEFKNDRLSGSRLMDSMLKCMLDSKDEAERGRLD
jgi:hypothetical protein